MSKMSAPKPFQGHHCWNCWNVSLWIANDEPLYRAALECVQRLTPAGKAPTLARAVRRFALNVAPTSARTPDGARFSGRAVRAALAGLSE